MAYLHYVNSHVVYPVHAICLAHPSILEYMRDVPHAVCTVGVGHELDMRA